MIGQDVSHYKIIEKLGQGGMGSIYLAEDTLLKRKVALKFFSPALESNGTPEMLDRLLREAQTTAALNHPNIVTIYEIAQFHNRHFIAMEYVAGISLRKRLVTQPPSLEEALDIAIQISEGLQIAHKSGIVHRDLKPENIIVDQHGRIKILDFGLAKLRGGNKITREATRLGTPEYMAPEQVLSQEVDQRADIFAVGAILYEMLAFQPPFQGEHEVAIVYAILNTDPPALNSVRSDLPASLPNTVRRALEKTPQKRFQKISDLLAELRRAQRELTQAEAPPVDEPHSMRRWFSRRALTALLLALLAIGAFVIFQTTRPPDNEPPVITLPTNLTIIAVFPFEVRGSSNYFYLGEGMVDLLGAKLNGAGELRSVDSRALLSFVKHQDQPVDTPAKAREIARHFNAAYYIQGEILEAGGQLNFNATLYDVATAGRRAQATGTGADNDIFTMIDQLAAQLIGDLVKDPTDRFRELAALTTTSVPALKAFLEGERKFREGRYVEALEAFQHAVSDDRDFALAYYRLSLTADWLTRPEIANDAAIKADAHSHKLSEHDRMLLHALRAWQTGEVAAAERIYRAITGTYTEDFEAWFQLGEVLFHYGPLRGQAISVSRPAFERVWEIEPYHVPSLVHLARITARIGEVERLDTLAAQIAALQPGGERALEIPTLRAFVVGDSVGQQQAIAALRTANDLIVTLATWNVATYSNNLDGAIKLARLLTAPQRSSEARALGHLFIAHLELAHGRLRAAHAAVAEAARLEPATGGEYAALFAALPFLPTTPDQVEAAIRGLQTIDPKTIAPNVTPNVFFTVHNGIHEHIQNYVLGLLYTRAGRDTATLRHAARLEELWHSNNRPELARNLHLALKAQVAARNYQQEEAARLFDEMRIYTWYGLMVASPIYSQALNRYAQAANLELLQRSDEALRLYNSFAENSVFDLIYLAPSHLRQAEIYDRLNQPDKAREHYQAFVTLWQHADGELAPQLTKARQRIDELSLARE